MTEGGLLAALGPQAAPPFAWSAESHRRPLAESRGRSDRFPNPDCFDLMRINILKLLQGTLLLSNCAYSSEPQSSTASCTHSKAVFVFVSNSSGH